MSFFTRSLAASLFVSFAATAVGQAPIGHWNLNETAGSTANDSANGNDGLWQNGGSNFAWTPNGIIGRAVDLQGNNDNGANYFSIGTIPQFTGSTSVTLSAWIQPDSQTDQGGGGYNGVFMSRGENWGIAYESNNHTDNRSIVSGGTDSTSTVLPNGSWYHAAMTYDSVTGTRNVYINGALNNSQVATTGAVPSAAAMFNIGTDLCCTAARDFDGRVDDISLYGSALSASQVQQVYTAGLNNVSAANSFTAGPALGEVQQGLVGSWSMDQAAGTMAAGDSINGNHAVLSGATPSTAWVPGQVGRALNLDGSNDQAVIPGISQINGASEMTISMWVRNDGGNEGYEGLFQHRSGDNSNQQGLMTPSNQINPNGGNQPNDVMGRLVNNGTIITTPGNSLPTGGVWSHVVQRYEAGVLHEILIDGVSVALDAAPPNVPIVSDGAWRFGNDQCCGNRFFDGAIDDTGLWSRSLSNQEIAAIRTAGLNSISHTRAFIPETTPIQSDLVGHWTFDQARFSPAANDSIANANATLSGMESGSDWVAGQAGGALQFDGGNDQAVISGAMASQLNTALNGSTALTMSIWVRQDGANENNEGIFEHRSSNLTGFNTPSSAVDNIQFRINSAAVTSDANVLENGQWQHLVGVWEANERFELWVDGILTAEGTAPAGPLLADGDWRFGNDACCGNRFFEGALDDAALWGRALTSSEIAGLYLAGLEGLNAQQAVATPEPASIALWSLLGAGLFGIAAWRRRKQCK